MAAEVEECDEGGQHAVADPAQGQAEAVRGHAEHHVAEGKMLAGGDGNRALAAGQGQAECADQHDKQADRGQAPLLIKNHAQWSA